MTTAKAAPQHIRFIISTKAGHSDKSRIRETVLAFYQGATVPDIQMTEHANHASELATEWAALYGASGIIYVAGGDGTMNEVAQALAGTETYMGVIPLGTGNDFARTLYPGIKRKQALKELVPLTHNPTLRTIDLLSVNGIPFINLMSLGYDTVVLRQAYKFLKKWRKLGGLAYGLAVLTTLGAKKYYPLRYTLIDETGQSLSSEKTSTIAVLANGRHYGSGYMPTPNAYLNDGFGDFLIADSVSMWELVTLLGKYKKGTHLGHPKIKSTRFTKAILESPDGSNYPANYDGVIFDTNRWEVEVLPAALHFAELPYGDPTGDAFL